MMLSCLVFKSLLAAFFVLARIDSAVGFEITPAGKVSDAAVGSETTDGDALCVLYSSVANTNALSNWCGAKDDSSEDGNYLNGPCMGASPWNGVTCTNGRVTGVAIGGTGLGEGIIPTQLGGLTGLTKLYIDFEEITGSIPTQLGLLTGLTQLGLGSNKLTGSIPTQLGGLTALTGLFLYINSLSGGVPKSLCNLNSTAFIEVYQNPGLTCFAQCLEAYPNFIRQKGSLTAVCGAGTNEPMPPPVAAHPSEVAPLEAEAEAASATNAATVAAEAIIIATEAVVTQEAVAREAAAAAAIPLIAAEKTAATTVAAVNATNAKQDTTLSSQPVASEVRAKQELVRGVEGGAGGRKGPKSVDSPVKPTELKLGGEAIAMEHLGPIIINADGTTRRIANWDSLSSGEKESSWRIIKARNEKRLAKLRETDASLLVLGLQEAGEEAAVLEIGPPELEVAEG